MGRSIHRLTAVKVNALKRPGYHADGAGLYLKIQDWPAPLKRVRFD